MILDFQRREGLLKKYGLKRPYTFLVQNQDEAVEKFHEIGCPVVLKISSDKHLHRTELGGVELNLSKEEDVIKAYDRLSGIDGIEGVMVQEFISGVEFIVGAKNDPVFGAVVMVGTGGTLVELFKDVSFKIAPIDHEEAKKMIEEIKGSKLLEGFRGKPELGKDDLIEILKTTSDLAYKEDVKELDFNPVIVNEEGAFICDVKIVL